jgi:hypothetical protein
MKDLLKKFIKKNLGKQSFFFILVILFLALRFFVSKNLPAYAQTWQFDPIGPTVYITPVCNGGSFTSGTLECTGNSINVNGYYHDPAPQSGLKSISLTIPSLTGCTPNSSTFSSPYPTNLRTLSCEISRNSTTYTYNNITASATDAAGNTNSLTGSTSITVSFISPWYQLKNASFHKLGSPFNNLIPLSPLNYDTGTNVSRALIINDTNYDPGVVTYQASTYNLNSASFSSKNWSTSYTKNSFFDFNAFKNYLDSRKGYKTIANIDNDNINADGIYFYNGTLPLNLTIVPDHKFLLLVNGTVTITGSGNKFNPSSSIAIIAQTINFANDLTEASGIFYAESINFGTSNTPLKITGNVISKTAATLSRDRANDRQKPSLFIVFDPQKYLDLLPYLSVANYDWQQLK